RVVLEPASDVFTQLFALFRLRRRKDLHAREHRRALLTCRAGLIARASSCQKQTCNSKRKTFGASWCRQAWSASEPRFCAEEASIWVMPMLVRRDADRFARSFPPVQRM